MRIAFLTAALLAASGAPAFATTQAAIQLNQVTATVVDLDAGDGLSASFAWQGGWRLNAFAYTYTQDQWGLYSSPWGNLWSQQWTASYDQLHPYAQHTEFAQLSNTHGGATSKVLDGAVALNAAQDVASGHGGRAGAEAFQSFMIGAGTAVTFSVIVDAGVSGAAYTGAWTPAPGTGIAPGSYHSRANADAWLNVSGNGQWLDARLSNVGAGYWWNGQSYFQAPLQGSVLELTIRNESGVDQYYDFRASAWAFAEQSLAPVPEPSSYALMGAGLLAVGAIARRRRARG